MEEEEAKEAQSRLLIRRRGRSSASKVEHSVEDLGGDGDLGGPGLVAVEAQPVTDDLLPTRELALNAGSFVIAAVALPGHPPLVSDCLDVAVALGVSAVALSTASTRGGTTTVAAGWRSSRVVYTPVLSYDPTS